MIAVLKSGGRKMICDCGYRMMKTKDEGEYYCLYCREVKKGVIQMNII